MTVELTVNGDDRQLIESVTVDEMVTREVDDEADSVAVAVNDEVIPRDRWQDTQLQSGDEVEIIRPIQGGQSSDDSLVIADQEFGSRLIVGTGGHTNLEKMKQALERSETEMVTVGLRRVNVDSDQRAGLMDIIRELDLKVLPNTAGCYTADDAVKTAQMGREALDTNWVKLEVIGDDQTLYPETEELLKAARELVEQNFVVLPYTTDDPVTAKKLVSIGCPVVMPLASPIGSGRGIANPENLKIIRDEVDVPVIVDAGIGSASDAAEAMELGADAILTSSAIAHAEDPPQMAEALKHAVQAGRQCYKAGQIPDKLYANESTTMDGRIR